MNTEAVHPRVLIVHRSAIGDRDPSGISLGRWFGAWPKGNLGQIYSSRSVDGQGFCPATYEFGHRDRRFGALFSRAKGSSWSGAFLNNAAGQAAPRNGAGASLRKWKSRAVAWVVANGLWEIVFPVNASRELLDWCQRFNPDILYSSCTDISYIDLTLQLKRLLKVPLCLQVDDDWMGSRYRSGLGRVSSRPILERRVRTLLAETDLRISNGPLMTRVYHERYGVKFEPLYLADDISRFDAAREGGSGHPEGPVIVYCGSLILGRWQGIVELDDALESLGGWGEKVSIHVHTHHVPIEAADAFRSRARIRVLPGPSDAEVPRILTRADLLFLPESFSTAFRDYIHLSISSKAHLYMMSGRPALVYGPAGVGVVEYARHDKWARVVDRPDRLALAAAVRELISDPGAGPAQVSQAREVALRNHQIQQVRERFRRMLIEVRNRA